MPLTIQVERFSLARMLVKGTVDCITPVMEEEEEGREEEKQGMKEGGREGDTMTREVKREGEDVRKKVKYFQVLLRGGVTLTARWVVMATGPTRAQMANIPPWVRCIEESYPEERMQHTVHLMHHLPVARQQLQETGSQRQEGTLASPGELLLGQLVALPWGFTLLEGLM